MAIDERKVTYDGRLKAFAPRYCSLCNNRPMAEEVIGALLWRSCEHYVFYRELTPSELRKKAEQVA